MEKDSIKKLSIKFIEDMSAAGAGSIAMSCVDTLVDWGFFNMPASTRYHGTNEGDLFEHSHTVAHLLSEMTEKIGLVWQNPRSPILIGFFHDLCKCDSYRRSVVGQTVDGLPVVDNSSWERRKDQILLGHGDKSVMLASTLCKLTEEEMLCIRYHMGAYQTDDWDGYDRAICKYQTVLWTHHADMLASKVMGI